jgi:hypothetical protein
MENDAGDRHEGQSQEQIRPVMPILNFVWLLVTRFNRQRATGNKHQVPIGPLNPFHVFSLFVYKSGEPVHLPVIVKQGIHSTNLKIGVHGDFVMQGPIPGNGRNLLGHERRTLNAFLYLPFHWGSRFSRKARTPSMISSVWALMVSWHFK